MPQRNETSNSRLTKAGTGWFWGFHSVQQMKASALGLSDKEGFVLAYGARIQTLNHVPSRPWS